MVRLLTAIAVAAGLSRAATPIAEDRGVAGIAQAVRRLNTSARVLYITAHPDDEDGGTITWLTRGYGAHVTLLSLTRGEAGANLITSDFFDSLGALRTLELTRAAEYYGCRVRFTSFIDYGYSKNVEEAWRNWDREKLLADVVRVVRQEQPHVILARWQGTARDGHGHHSAAGVMAQLAFDPAADPGRFPEQIREGLKPWKPLKLYSNNRREVDDWTVKIDSGAYDPALGRSYAQIARDGLRWQRSQGAGAVVSRPGPSVSYYLRLRPEGPVKERGFFDGIEAVIAPQRELREFARSATPESLAKGLAKARELGDGRAAELWRKALNLSLGLELEAIVQPKVSIVGPMAQFRPYETFRMAVPGQRFDVAVTLHDRTESGAEILATELVAPPGWLVVPKAGGVFAVEVPAAAKFTEAFWRRDTVRTLNYSLDDLRLFGIPLPAPPVVARVRYRYAGVEGEVQEEARVSRIDSLGVQHFEPLAVGPRISVRFVSDFGVLPKNRSRYEATVAVKNLGSDPAEPEVHLELPEGWTSSPRSAKVVLDKEGEEAPLTFMLEAAPSGDAALQAVARIGDATYRTSFVPHTFANLDTLYVDKPARHTVRRVDVRVAEGIRAGYAMGTGDDVPNTLRQLGVPYDLLDTAALAHGDLSKYSVILLGIRAYAARSDVRTYKGRLLDYVKQGGVLVAQYNTPEYDNNYGPYPYRMGRNPEEVSEEDSPVTILDPADPVFQRPNKILPEDFKDWVEQRGSKFFMTWDQRWKPLLETHDTGQAPQRGGWMVARHGDGLYVYCAYAWYRQLPFAVPGAVRLFANLVSLQGSRQQ